MIKVLQILCFGNFIVQTPLTAKSGWRWILKNTWRAGMLCQKCASQERKKAVWISCHVPKDREAGGQEHKIGECSSLRILFILLSPTLNWKLLIKYQNSEENKFLPSSLFSVSTFRSARVSPAWETAIGSAVPVMGREVATPSSVSVSMREWLLHGHTGW